MTKERRIMAVATIIRSQSGRTYEVHVTTLARSTTVSYDTYGEATSALPRIIASHTDDQDTEIDA
jgi:hypothetical protein